MCMHFFAFTNLSISIITIQFHIEGIVRVFIVVASIEATTGRRRGAVDRSPVRRRRRRAINGRSSVRRRRRRAINGRSSVRSRCG